MPVDFEDLYDFPMSHGYHRAMCRLHGREVPPNVDVDPWTLTEEEHRQQFIKWQDEQREIMFGGRAAWTPPKPVAMHSPPPEPKRLKGIET